MAALYWLVGADVGSAFKNMMLDNWLCKDECHNPHMKIPSRCFQHHCHLSLQSKIVVKDLSINNTY